MSDVNVSTARETLGAPREADNPRDSLLARFGADKPLKLDAGVELSPVQIAYKTYGTLNAECSNAILVCHALTGDQHVASVHPVTEKSGWWETMVGPGKPIDTERYFVICPNVVGACMGSTGPSSNNPATGKPELTWFKALQGNDNFYLVQKAFKFEPSGEQVTDWVNFLNTVKVCDTRLPDRACP